MSGTLSSKVYDDWFNSRKGLRFLENYLVCLVVLSPEDLNQGCGNWFSSRTRLAIFRYARWFLVLEDQNQRTN